MKLARRKFLRTGAGSLALLATSGCDKLPRELRVLFLEPEASGRFQPPAQASVDPVIHALNRAAFGPRPGDYERIRKLANTADNAAAEYIEEQLSPERIDDEAGE